MKLTKYIGCNGTDYSPEGLWSVATRRFELEDAVCHFLDGKFSTTLGWLDSETMEKEFTEFYIPVIHECWVSVVTTDVAYRLYREVDRHGRYRLWFRPTELYDTYMQ
jgi:hypothetical protein